MSALWDARPANPLRLVEADTRVPFAAPGMPSDIDLERAVLGSILLSEKVLPVLASDDRLTIECFYRGWHRDVYRAMLTLNAKDEPVDALTVRQALLDAGASREQAANTDDLVGAVGNLANVRAYARRLVALAGWRTVKHAGIELVAAADTLDLDRRDTAEGLLGAKTRHTSTMTGGELADMLYEHLDRGDQVKALPFPFFGLMPFLGGLRPGETTLVGGWTSRGKSVIVDMILTSLGRLGHQVHLYINEMTVKIRAMRILSAEAGIPLPRLLNRATMQPENHAAAAAMLAKGMPFGITDVAGWTAQDIARDIRLHGWDLAAVDILHLIEHREVKDLDAISQTLTLAAKTSGAHLIATVHLNEERAKHAQLPTPVIRDIRGSGMLKNNADNVLFVHREDDLDPNGIPLMSDRGTLTLAKCRNGSLGGISVEFDGRHVRYREMPR